MNDPCRECSRLASQLEVMQRRIDDYVAEISELRRQVAGLMAAQGYYWVDREAQ
jgi:hypothetical protein